MMRLLDTNVFITAKNLYYALDLVPAFWSWLEEQAHAENLASTDLVYQELKDGGDDLADWVKKRRNLMFRVKSHSPEIACYVGSISEWAQSNNYSSHAIAHFLGCADPFLIAAAANLGGVVVTQEIPSGSQRRIKIPNVCRANGGSLREHLPNDA